MSSADRLKRLERLAAGGLCSDCRDRWRVVYENDWRKRRAEHEAAGTIPSAMEHCERCGRSLRAIFVMYVDDWRNARPEDLPLPKGR